jgi:hypothetical protein
VVPPNYTLLGGEAAIPISLEWKNYLTEGTTAKVLENTSAIYINKGSDNNQAHTSNLEITVFRTSNR